MKTWSDSELFEELKKDNKMAFSILFDRYSDILFRFIQKRIESIPDVEDIIQEVFISMWNRRSKIEVGDSIYPYLFKAAKYEMIDWLIKSEKRNRHLDYLEINKDQYLIGNTSEDELIAKELARLLENEMSRMPDTMRSVFRLSRSEDMSIKDIANQLSLSEQTVKNNVSMALNRLKFKLK
ncbi:MULTISPECIES: RNA polymerase sigma factor [Sphingobacterium]|uniref:RNA polymerase sigma factor n=1 Tax=Sphingobacterium TaxID=28453 RepID=UPI001044492B|nr:MULTISPECIES: sigma-70 family RNA polymerase sigma factor [unclassified Sphingobacterium]MBB2950384.1 RNA polymerase sigma-70 factor (ECF subfamily) [Sphingobacterium sp. JUb56]MCS3553016.1 RNA polymerase sigma-70 factor (ECF subfamily) [Sphingobacterium sp. JUb21]TCR10230.1 RNA polymerase sigma-70 factor (ECF subfamily) [Sphingobacterium sp. JUb20]